MEFLYKCELLARTVDVATRLRCATECFRLLAWWSVLGWWLWEVNEKVKVNEYVRWSGVELGKASESLAVCLDA